MKARINRLLFTQTSLDSGALTMLGAVIHSFSEPGRYRGTVSKAERPTARFSLTVDDDCTETQVNVDLANLERDEQFQVNPRGFVVFHVSRGAGGYAVRVGRLSGEKEEAVFDSRELRNGDMFAATLIRPGTYTVANVNNRARGQVVVAYPKVGDAPYRPPDPVAIASAGRTLRPNRTMILPAQGQIYRISTPSRIKIDLVKPDDGPKGTQPPWSTGWRKPVATGPRPISPTPEPAVQPRARALRKRPSRQPAPRARPR